VPHEGSPGTPEEDIASADLDAVNANPSMPGHRRRMNVVQEAVLAAGVVALAYALLLPGPYAVGSYGDDAYYVILGKALAGGMGYRSLYLPGHPVHLQYPPGLPAVVAVLWRFGGSLHAVANLARILDVAAISLVAGAVWWIGRSRLGLSPAIAALFGIGPLFLDSALQYFGLVLAEPWFMLGWALALVLACRAGRSDRAPDGLAAETHLQPGSRPVLPYAGVSIAVGLVLGATALFRTQALALLPAFALGLRLRTRSWRPAALCLAVGLAPVALWGLLHARFVGADALGAEGQRSYLQDLHLRGTRDLLHLLDNAEFNAKGYLVLFALYTSFSLPVGFLLVATFSALTVAGLFRALRAHPELALAVALNAAVILLWPYNIDRFVVSALPFAGLCAALPLQSLLDSGAARVRPAVVLLLLLAVGYVAARQVALRRDGSATVTAERRPAFWTPSWEVPFFDRFIRLTSRWARSRTSPGDRILTAWPVAIQLATGRQTFDTEGASAGTGADSVGPGAELARQILRDSAHFVVVAHPEHHAAGGVAAIRRDCPDTLSRDDVGSYRYPAFYHVSAQGLSCLSGLANRKGPGDAGR
jgi:hypothetical protein